MFDDNGWYEELSQRTLVQCADATRLHQSDAAGRTVPARQRHQGRIGAGQCHAHHRLGLHQR